MNDSKWTQELDTMLFRREKEWGGKTLEAAGWREKPKPLFSNNTARLMAGNPTEWDFDSLLELHRLIIPSTFKKITLSVCGVVQSIYSSIKSSILKRQYIQISESEFSLSSQYMTVFWLISLNLFYLFHIII